MADSIQEIVNFIWPVADEILRDDFKRGKYPDVILPFTVRVLSGSMRKRRSSWTVHPRIGGSLIYLGLRGLGEKAIKRLLVPPVLDEFLI